MNGNHVGWRHEMTIEELNKAIEFKREIIAMTELEIKELEINIALAETEADEKPCRVWDIGGEAKG
jgi:hypothetical protein